MKLLLFLSFFKEPPLWRNLFYYIQCNEIQGNTDYIMYVYLKKAIRVRISCEHECPGWSCAIMYDVIEQKNLLCLKIVYNKKEIQIFASFISSRVARKLYFICGFATHKL